MQKDYLSVIYDEKTKPKTDYPSELIAYLIKKYDLKTNGNLLEIGCGRGDFLDEFSKAGFKCYGVDIEKRSIELLPHLIIKQCNIAVDKLSFEDNTFDVVFHKSLIEHLPDPNNLMSETFRVLKKGGKIIILTPDWESQMKNFYDDFTHSHPYTIESIKNILSIWGFKSITSEKFQQLPILWKFKSLAFISKIIGVFIPVRFARWLTQLTGIKYFRWSVELMVLGNGEKENA
ncbi:MAG: class I SAM-dependent methyltransferase [Elusimicrobia bacterium]|nr:class I SAM-dependent methyltransferase [Candidatus Liberimonas magnetica]